MQAQTLTIQKHTIRKRLFAAGKNSLQTGVRHIITQHQIPGLFGIF